MGLKFWRRKDSGIGAVPEAAKAGAPSLSISEMPAAPVAEGPMKAAPTKLSEVFRPYAQPTLTLIDRSKTREAGLMNAYLDQGG